MINLASALIFVCKVYRWFVFLSALNIVLKVFCEKLFVTIMSDCAKHNKSLIIKHAIKIPNSKLWLIRMWQQMTETIQLRILNFNRLFHDHKFFMLCAIWHMTYNLNINRYFLKWSILYKCRHSIPSICKGWRGGVAIFYLLLYMPHTMKAPVVCKASVVL